MIDATYRTEDVRSIAKLDVRVQAQAKRGAPVRVPLGLKSSPSSVTQRVLTSLLKARDLAVAASCMCTMTVFRLQRRPLYEYKLFKVCLLRGCWGQDIPSSFAQRVLALFSSLRDASMAACCTQVHHLHGACLLLSGNFQMWPPVIQICTFSKHNFPSF